MRYRRDRAKYPLALFLHVGQASFTYQLAHQCRLNESAEATGEDDRRFQEFAFDESVAPSAPDNELLSLQAAFRQQRFDLLETVIGFDVDDLSLFCITDNRFEEFRRQPASDAEVRCLLHNPRLSFHSSLVGNSVVRNIALYTAQVSVGDPLPLLSHRRHRLPPLLPPVHGHLQRDPGSCTR